MAYFYASVTVILASCVFGVLLYSVNNKDRALWPPNQFGMQDRIVTWTVTVVAIGCAYLAGRASWNEWGAPDWLRWYIGFPIAFIASSVSSLAIVQLGLDQSMGAKGPMKTDQLFVRSRHPTYLANILLCAGFVLLAASTPTLLAAGSLAALYIAAAPLEERWLEQQHGALFQSYRATTPRWL